MCDLVRRVRLSVSKSYGNRSACGGGNRGASKFCDYVYTRLRKPGDVDRQGGNRCSYTHTPLYICRIISDNGNPTVCKIVSRDSGVCNVGKYQFSQNDTEVFVQCRKPF